jgi:phosphatidate cytidylyltransferase
MAERQVRERMEGHGADLRARVLVAIPAIVFAVAIVHYGGLVFAIGAIALGLVCLHELFGMLDEARPARLAGFLGVIGLGLAALYGEPFHVVLAFVAVLPVLFALTVAQRPPAPSTTLSMAVVVLGVAWVGLGIAHAVMLRELEHGAGIIVAVLVGTFIGDSAAYSGGKAFGRTPLAPRLSPNKTLEGLAFGIVGGTLAVWFAGLYMDWLSGTDALLLGLAVTLVAPIGDLFESTVKRDVGTKDSGTLFGAHGGALDRLDAVLFTLPVGFYVWTAML